MRVAMLDRERLEKVQDLERDLGTFLVALEREFSLADLSEEQLKQLQQAEEEMGIVLLAYRSE
jgi:hypothetical protein